MFKIVPSPMNNQTPLPVTDEIRQAFKYQPFILPDGSYTGAGEGLLTASARRVLLPSELQEHYANTFLDANRRLARMYEDFLSAIVEHGGSPANLSYCDFACNAGYFCYRMLQLGARSSVGFDSGNYAPAFDYVAKVAGLKPEFIRASYDPFRHAATDAEMGEFDIISCIAFLCHMSDPQYLVHYLGQRAKRSLLIFSKFSRNDRFVIEFSTQTSRYFQQRFPVCFDSATSMSDSLLRFGLRDMGFRNIIEIERKDYWVMGSDWRCFLALR